MPDSSGQQLAIGFQKEIIRLGFHHTTPFRVAGKDGSTLLDWPTARIGKAGRERTEKLNRRRDPKATPPCHGRCEMFGVVRDQPIGPACDRGEQHGNIRRVTNQMTSSQHLGLIRKRHDLRLHQSDRMDIAFQHLLRVVGRHPAQTDRSRSRVTFTQHGGRLRCPKAPLLGRRGQRCLSPPPSRSAVPAAGKLVFVIQPPYRPPAAFGLTAFASARRLSCVT